MSIIRETPRNRFVPPYEKKELENWNEKKSEEIAVVENQPPHSRDFSRELDGLSLK